MRYILIFLYFFSLSYVNAQSANFDPNIVINSFINTRISDTFRIVGIFTKKVILVSPQTLMAYLETIRHSMKLFSLQTATKNILATHEKVKNEIRKFIESFDDVTKRLDQTVESFEKLKSTRVNKLEKSFEELDEVNKNTED